MLKTFTPNDLLLFYYKETDAEETLMIKNALVEDDELKEEIKKTLPKDIPHLFISSVAQTGLTELKDTLWQMLNS